MPLPRLFIITGQFRSGTSAVAQVVNRLGAPVAVTVGCPHPACGWQLDWEDPETFRVLNRWIPLDRPRQAYTGLTNAIREDFRRRWLWAQSLADVGGTDAPTVIAAKCPLFALCYEEVVEACVGLFDVDLIALNRRQEEIDASVDRSYWSEAFKEAVRGTNEHIEDALGRIEAHQTDYRELCTDPETITSQLAAILGLPWCKEASDLIRRTSVPKVA